MTAREFYCLYHWEMAIIYLKNQLTFVLHSDISVLTQLIHIERMVHQHVTKLCESVRRKMKLFGNRTEKKGGCECYDTAELP